MKPFDLDAAKRGAPIEMLHCGEWQPCRFVGMSGDGFPVVETSKPAFVAWTTDKLRMAPRHVLIYIELWREESGRFTSRVVHPDGYNSDLCVRGEKIDTISYMVCE